MQDKNQQEMQPDKEQLNRMLRLPCSACGSQLTYSAEKKLLVCTHCGNQEGFAHANDRIQELSLDDAMRQSRSFSPQAISKQVLSCDVCSAEIMVEDNDVQVRCNFCGSHKVNKKAFDRNLIQPQGIVPFLIPKQEAVDAFRKWIQEGWFRPNALKKIAELGELSGIYVPFWTYDAQTQTSWSGEAGYYYYETEYVMENGEQKEKKVRKVRWEWRSGRFSRFFDDILILASKNLPIKVVESIYPYELEKTINYEPKLMLGWQAEIYNIDVKEGYSKAESIIESELRSQASKALGGDTQRGLRVDSQKYGQTFKHLILPLWLCSYMYNGKVYRFAVNGQTGKISGEKPFSWVKIFFFVLSLLLVIGLALVLFGD